MTTSDFETFCDALLEDLTLNVPSLGTVTPHRLAPWDPEELVNDGSKHLAVWPFGEEGTETAEPSHMSADNLIQGFRVQYWEPAEPARGKVDEQAASSLLVLQNEMRARLYAGLAVEGYWKIRYQGAALPERSSEVRWFRLTLAAWTGISYSP